MMSKRRAEEDENEAPTAKARRSNQASTSKKARNGVDSAGGRSQGAQVVQVERFGASINNHLRQSGAGQIKQVKVTNFMCHSNMKVDFNEHVNFISGPNGSGKSAILQALQYCLGVRATATGRAQSNAAYLKKGEEICTAEVTLWNTGPEEDTFDPGLYGPTITIHKTLNSKGLTTTKVLDHRGNRTDLTKADDVRRLLAKLSVNAANPSIVLTQDQARGLLTGKSVTKSLYGLLEESLDYKSTLTYMNMAMADIKEQRAEVGAHKEARKETEEKLNEISERVTDAELAYQHTQLAEDLADHKAWAVVRHLRKKIEEVEESLKDGPERQKQLQHALEQKEQELRELEARSAQLGQLEEELMNKINECAAAREELRIKRKNAMAKKNKVHGNINKKQQQMQSAQQDKAYAEQQIAAVRSRGDDQESIDKQMAEWHAAHTQATEMVQASQQAAHEQRRQNDDLDAAFQAAQNAHADAKRECANAKSKVQQATNELHHIQRSSGPHQDAIKFDDQAGPLLDAIHKNKQRFRMPVLGPVGACLSLEASANKYSATICGALKHVLPAWIVDSREDQQTFLALAKRVCRRGQEPKVFIMKFNLPAHTERMHANQLPVESITTIMNVLRVKDGVDHGHVVMNVLIDHGGIERIGLADDERAGHEILDNGNLWKNLQKVMCNAQGGPVEMVKKGNMSNVWTWNFAPPEPLLSGDKSQLIAARQRNVESESQRLQAAQDFEIEQQSGLNAAKQAQQAAANEMYRLQEQIKRAKKQEQVVNTQRPEVRASADDELGEAIEQSENAQQELARLTPELNDLMEQYEQTKVELEEANQEQKLHQQQNQKYEQQVEGQLAFVSEAESAKQKVQITKDALLKKMEKIDTTRQQHEKTREDFANVLSQCLEDAKSTCSEEQADQERPALKEKLMELTATTSKSPYFFDKKKYGDLDKVLDDKDSLNEMVKRIEANGLKLQKRANGKLEELQLELETLETKHGANRNQTGNFEALVSSQSESFAVRKAKFLEIRANVDQAINKKFKDMLRTGRNWRGKIQVDHDSHEVFLSVTPHKGASTEGAAAVKDMKSLSGGERSFTSVSFVLSLGQEISTPFFAMDEFDVFMDAVNRKVALTSILKFAWELTGTQFILLSPLDMSVVEQSRADVNADFREKSNGCKVEEMPKEFIKCVAMQPPREGARAHF